MGLVPALPNLRRLRQQAALSQRELAERAQVRVATVTDLEAGRTEARPSTIRKLADALKCEPRELMVRDG